MKVAVISFFRNSANGQAQFFLRQAARLRDKLAQRGDKMRIIAVYGDCTDNTGQVLVDGALEHDFALTLVERSHGGPVFGSTEAPARLVALSYVGNGGLEAVLPQDDAVFYVESDLIWIPENIIHLLDRLGDGVDVVAPLIFAGAAFYDIFVFRKNGVRFSPFFPFHPELKFNGELTPIDSAGSCLVMKAEVARNCRIIDNNVLLGFCQDVWNHGYTVNVDSSVSIYHP